MLRITFNLKLEVPLFYGYKDNLKTISTGFVVPNVNLDYLKMLTNIANNKMKDNLSKIEVFYQEFKNKFNPSFKWYLAYENQPQLLTKQVSKKMDILYQKIQIATQSLSNLKHSETLSIITVKLRILRFVC